MHVPSSPGDCATACLCLFSVAPSWIYAQPQKSKHKRQILRFELFVPSLQHAGRSIVYRTARRWRGVPPVPST